MKLTRNSGELTGSWHLKFNPFVPYMRLSNYPETKVGRLDNVEPPDCVTHNIVFNIRTKSANLLFTLSLTTRIRKYK